MAKTTDQYISWHGDKSNDKRMIIGIPAGPDGDDPGLIFLESSSSAGTIGGIYVWADSSNVLHYSATKPTDEDGDGTALDSTTIAGASTKALDNLSGVAINTSLVSDTTATDNLGSSSIYWNNAYVTTLLLDSTHTMTTGVFAGNWAFGVSGTGVDVQLFGDTTGSDVLWDCSADSLIFEDDALLVLGTDSDVVFEFNGTTCELDFVAANTVLNFGATAGNDLVLHGASAGSDITWDASGDVMYFADDTHLAFGDGIDMYLNFDATDLELRQTTPGTGGLKIGVDDAGIDITIFGDTSAYGVTWDASADTMTYLDSTKMAFGTSDDITFSYDGVNNELDILGSGKAVLFGVNDTGIDVKFFGATAGDYMLWDETNDTLLFEDATISVAGANVTYTLGISTDELLFDGTDHANNGITFGTTGTHGTDITFQTITAGDTMVFDAGAKTFTLTDVKLSCVQTATAGVCLQLSGPAAQTVAIIDVVGTTGAGWDGASGVGMVNIASDGAFVNAASSSLNITTGTSAAIANGRGSGIRIVDTQTAGDDHWVAYIDTTNNDGLLITTGAVTDINLKLTGIQAQTNSMMIIDGSTGTGWDGADDVGMLQLTSDSAHVHAGATMLRVANSAQSIASAQGTLARFENTGTARAGAVMVEVVAKDATECALNVGSGYSTFAHKATFTAGQQSLAVARTATDAGDGDAVIADGTTYVEVTSGGANKLITLPTPTPGTIVWLYNAATGYELRSSAPSTVAINGGTGATAEAAVPATYLVRCVCTSATKWVANKYGPTGTVSILEAAA